MALTGLQIYKHLPKENCKECGLPTCLAFAMKVAAGQAGLDSCPRLTEEAQAQLSEASAPPQRLVHLGAGPRAIEIGQETVLFRHDEKFHHPTAIALRLEDTMGKQELRDRCAAFGQLQFTRVGTTIQPDAIALYNASGDVGSFMSAAEVIYNELGVPTVLISDQVDALSDAAKGPLSGSRPLLYYTSEGDDDKLAEAAKGAGAAVCVGGDIEKVASRAEALSNGGVSEIVISPAADGPAEALAFLTTSRRACLKKNFRPLGCPVLVTAEGEDAQQTSLAACAYVCKYAGVLVTDLWAPALLLPVLTTRQNIYTDPQKPIQIEEGLYEVGTPSEDSPVLVTTNFSLTYFTVEGDVEASRVPAWVVVVDTEGTSVLTAWAAEKFTPEVIAAKVKAFDVASKVKHRKLIIPGHVAVLSGKLEEELSDEWKVLVGPRESSGIPSFLRSSWPG
jgi:acetyl-CoA decarbonylase/synthase complex subunit gamma